MVAQYLLVGANYYSSHGIDKLTCRRGLALLDGDRSVLYVDANAHLERVLSLKDA